MTTTLRSTGLQCLIATGLLLTATSLWAHHSTTAVFEMQERVSWQGTLTKVDWNLRCLTVWLEPPESKQSPHFAKPIN